MRESNETVCFTCGLPAGEFPRLNHLPSGRVCPTCRDRLLAMLPPIFPGSSSEPSEVEEAVEALDGALEHLSPREVAWGPSSPDTPA